MNTNVNLPKFQSPTILFKQTSGLSPKIRHIVESFEAIKYRHRGVDPVWVLNMLREGRAKVLGTNRDPYKGFPPVQCGAKMKADADALANKFNANVDKLSDAQIMAALRKLEALRNGPPALVVQRGGARDNGKKS